MGEMTIDAQRGIAYIPLGSPTYDFYGVDRLGSNLFGTSIVALDARTGKRKWHFQLVHHDLWDMDPSAAPQLTTIRQNGRNRDVVVVSSKLTWLFVLDRDTGESIWPVEERTVPKSEMPGEVSWPTQPFPTNLPPYSRQSFTVDDVSPYLSPDEAETFKKRLAAATNKGLFTPISFNDTMHIPTSNGGVLFGGAASEPNGASTLSPTTTLGFSICNVQTRMPAAEVAVTRRRNRPDKSPINKIARCAMAQIDWASKTAGRHWSQTVRHDLTLPPSAQSLRAAKDGCRLSRTSPVRMSTTS
jgi:quinoprotein glucose dehydrogenase